MFYKSTRDSGQSFLNQRLSFSDVTLRGLAPDGGLYLPETLPEVTEAELEAWRSLPYHELGTRILSRFAPELESKLPSLMRESVSRFRVPEVVPLQPLSDSFYIAELFHGPTYSFKDVALQFLGTLLNELLKQKNETLHLLGATSGDTGGAAIYGVQGKSNLQLTILHPDQAISSVQRRQMCTVLEDNIRNIAVRGSFDDCQTLIKKVFLLRDTDSGVPRLGAINSINWCRIAVQSVYYFSLYLRVCRKVGDPVDFVVPTGNMGNILAGFLAKRIGLPIRNLIAATNQNDILDRVFSDCVYRTQKIQYTLAPAMDIVQPSNFERYFYFLCGQDGRQVRDFIAAAKDSERHPVAFPPSLCAQMGGDFLSSSCGDDEILSAVAEAWKRHQYRLDPHGACAYHAVREHGLDRDPVPLVCLETAHPAKFPDVSRAVQSRLESEDAASAEGFSCPPPEGLNFDGLPERCQVLPNDLDELLRVLKTEVWNR